MEFDNLKLQGDKDKMRQAIELLERANELLDEAFHAHLKEVARRAAESGFKIRRAFGNEQKEIK